MHNENIGRKLVLWFTEYSNEAYTDQMGIKHPGYIVKEQIPVTIIKVKKVPYLFGDGYGEGWLAKSDTGEEFTCNWNRFPDDSMTPTYYWDVKKDHRGLWEPVDAIQTQGWYPHVDEKGNQCIPINSVFCKNHNITYLKDGECWKCKHNL